MIRSLVIMFALLLGMLVTGCNGGSTTTSGNVVGGFVWYDVYGNGCGGLYEGCTYLDPNGIQKAHWFQDPFYNGFAEPVYKLVYDTDFRALVWAYGYEGINQVFYDYYTYRAINEGNEEKGRDILSTIGQRVEDMVRNAGKQWAEKHGVELSVGLKVAQAAHDWNKIAKTRERTEADLIQFTKRLTGAKEGDITRALKEGDRKSIDAVVEEAAQTWGTSPEQMKSIVRSIYGASL
jgi:hypothetical protein